MLSPRVSLDPSQASQAILQWYPINKGLKDAGELLFAAELFMVCNNNS